MDTKEDFMKKLNVKGSTGNSVILVGETLENCSSYLPDSRTIIITDTNIKKLYGSVFPVADVITIGTGEKIKTIDTINTIFEQLVGLEADRSTFILGIGGGIVCDITGFVASVYMRGTGFGFVSTTLLSQVDASVGGKNGVNFGGFKNMIGVFNQPEFVICDGNLLNTLPKRELLCGFAEIIKHAAISDAAMFAYLETHQEPATMLDIGAIDKLVYDSVVIKSGVVNRDEKEHGERRKLNFGHTFGHALEKLTGLPHGESVGTGMALAARLSVEKGLLSENDANRLISLIELYGLPTTTSVDPVDMLKGMKKDKKREGDRIHFIFLDKIGNAVVKELAFEELEILVKGI